MEKDNKKISAYSAKVEENVGKVKVTPLSPEEIDLPTTRLRLVTGSYEHNLLCLSLLLEKNIQLFTPIFHFTPHTQSIRCVATSKRYLVSGSNDELIRIYDLQKRKELGTLLHHSGSITCLEFFKSKWLFSGGGDGKIFIWRTKDWEALAELKGHKGAVNDFSIHPSGRVAISVGEDRTLRLWNLMTARKASLLKLYDTGLKVKWSSDGKNYVVGFQRKISVFDSEGEIVNTVVFHAPLYHLDIVVHNDVEYIVSSHGNGRIEFRELGKVIAEMDKEEEQEQEPSFVLQGHGTRVKQFSFFTANETLFLTSVSSDGNIVVWDLTLKDQVAVYQSGDRLNCCVMIPDDVEDLESMKDRKREMDAALSAEETEHSEVEEPPKKKKRAKVTIAKA